MSLLDPLVYRLNVDLVGKTALRLERRRSERRFRKGDWWDHRHLNPPLATSPWLFLPQ